MAKEEKIIKKKIENFILTSAFEMIYEESCDSKLSSEFYKTCNEAMIFVSKELNVTHFQSIMLAILANNLDSAFERRFLYKICFDKPTVATRKQIWKAMLPSLSCDEARSLAESNDFSGGQIENIARKQIVDSIFYEHHQGISQIRSYCHSENIRKSKSKRIGFLN